MDTARISSVWRGRLRPRWHGVRPWAILIAGMTVIVLGTIGYEHKHPEYDFFDALYRAIALFGLTGNEPPPVPWTLQVARLLGPLIFGYAALRTLAAVFRHEFRLVLIRALARDHIVIAGLGEKGFRLATALHAAGHRVLVVDRDPANPRIPGLTERGITVLSGDATDPQMLRRVKAGAAAYLIVVGGDDGTNIDIASAAERLTADRPRGVLQVLVDLEDPRLWALLSSAGVGSDQPAYRLEYFNVHAVAARAMLDRHPPPGHARAAAPEAGTAPPHVLVVGVHGVGAHLVLRLAAAWRREAVRTGQRLRITVAAAEAGAHVAALREEHPALDDICEIDTLPDAAAPTVAPQQTYVCLESESDALAAALDLRTIAPVDPSVVVAVTDDASGVARALRTEGRVLGGIHPFGVLSSTLTTDLLRDAETERLARAKHDEYVRAEGVRGVGADQNSSLRPWEVLPDALKDSNRRFADGISAKLKATGCLVVPAPLADPDDPGFAFTDEEVEALAVQEHDRWARDLRRDGWSPTTGAKDAERRLHPLLVPWEQLGEDDRDRDREPVREIPAMLAHAGFRVVRGDGGES